VPLPDRVRVRISSEAAGQIALTPVISQEMPMGDLLTILLGAVGKDAARVGEMLARGAVVQGASRFRWEAIAADAASIETALAIFPNAEPERPFDAGRCFQARLRGPRGRVELSRETADRRRFLARRSFWSALMEITAAFPPEYIGYSYRDHADEYRIVLSNSQLISQIHEAAGMLKHGGLTAQVRRLGVEILEFSVRR
jgi:hypothetical protein